jgi:hypothetical protein
MGGGLGRLHLNANTTGVDDDPAQAGVWRRSLSLQLDADGLAFTHVHGHLHKLQVTPWADYRGRRYGVDTGTMAEPIRAAV